MKVNQPKILAVIPGHIPSSVVLIENPLRELEKRGVISLAVQLNKDVAENDIKKSDLLVFHREIEPSSIKLLRDAFRFRKPYIYDIDDNFFELPLESEIGRLYRRPERQKILKQFIRFASLVQVYSNPMLERAGELNERVVKMSGIVDLSLFPNSPPKKQTDKFKLVFATSRDKDELHKLFLPDIKKLLDERGDEIEITFWGFSPPELKKHPNVRHLKLEPNYEKFIRAFCLEGFDAGLAPLKNDIFHRSKTNIKFREYSAGFVAGLYSNVDVYTDYVTHRETGMVVKSDKGGWYESVVELLENPELLAKIKANARRFVEQNFSTEISQAIWSENIHRVLSEKRELAMPEELLKIDEPLKRRGSSRASKVLDKGVKKLVGAKPLEKIAFRLAGSLIPPTPVKRAYLEKIYPDIVEAIKITYRHFDGFSPQLSPPLGGKKFLEYIHPPVNFEFSAISFAPVVAAAPFKMSCAETGVIGVEIASENKIHRQETIPISELAREKPLAIEFLPLRLDRTEFLIRFYTIGCEDILRIVELVRKRLNRFGAREKRAFCRFVKSAGGD
ncbi:MAG: hypothetical protein Kow0090_07560 [Myxococcota bacterium]